MRIIKIENKKRITRTESIRICLLMVISILLSGCSSLFSPVKNDQTSYLLTQPSTCLQSHKESFESIIILQPETVAVYNTREMAYSISPYQIAYFSKNQWAETPSQMLHPLIVNALEKTNYFRAVITPPFVGHYDYVLKTEIITLLQDFTQHPALLKLVIRVQLAKTSINHVIATHEFVICEPMPRRTPFAGVLAANQATSQFLTELAQFTLSSIRNRYPRLIGEG